MGKTVANQKSMLQIVLMAAAFCATFFLKIHVGWLILAAVLLGLGDFLRNHHGKEAKE